MSDNNSPVVTLDTSKGTIKIELNAEKAPKTVANFLQYVDDEHYDGTIFHRVIANFMVQGGGMLPSMSEKDTRGPIDNEANNGLTNDRGTVAMGRTDEPHSATAQFFINTTDSNSFLNHQSESPKGWGYCVFGKVIEGIEVIDEIRQVQTKRVGWHEDVPTEPILINTIRRA
jgi:peptidyl-prolyl cis-trans isomerase B (cyclophilin B)